MFEGLISKFLRWRADLTFRWFEANSRAARAVDSALLPPSALRAMDATEPFEEEFEPVRDPLDKEVAAIERSLSSLLDSGIELGPMYGGMSLREVAHEIGAGCEVLDHMTGGADALTSSEWANFVLCQMRDGPDYEGFENAIYVQDHCFDDSDEGAYRRLVRRIISLTGRDWPVESVFAQGAPGSRKWFDDGEPISISIDAQPEVSSFLLTHGKDFDWSLIDRLNMRLPPFARGRFALKFVDQTIIVVYLPREAIDSLNAICGGGFITTVGEDYSKRLRA